MRSSVVFVTVIGYTEAGRSSSASSNGVQVDLTPAVMGAVYHGGRNSVSATANVTSCPTSLEVTWDDAVDEESGISAFFVSVGTTPGDDDVVAARLVEGVATPTAAGDPDVRPHAVLDDIGLLADGGLYYVTVTAVNGAGLRSFATTARPLLVDRSPPVFVSISDRPASSSNPYSDDTSTVHAS